MRKRAIYYFLILVMVFILIKVIPSSNRNSDGFSKRAKISLREVGNQLLLSNQDSVSLVLPVKVKDDARFEFSFQKELHISPDSLVMIVKENVQAEFFPQNYQVEVFQCSDGEVAYSYEINEDEEKTIIPCASRTLPIACYTIEVQFLQQAASVQQYWILLLILVLAFITLEVVLRKRTLKKEEAQRVPSYTSIGSFRFYPDQNKLIKEAKEIALSKKECELLEIFVTNPNQVLKREDLTKRVWEDNGVFVGRSLDTYISKLRKKLQEDDRIKITNVHGVGYKLEVQ